MFGSILLTIYILFITTYLAVMAFAFYRVFIFCKNKDLAGYSKQISYVIMAIIIFIFASSFIWFGKFNWDDNLNNWTNKIFSNKEEKQEENKDIKKENQEAKSKSQVSSVNDDTVKNMAKQYNKNSLKFFGLDRFIKLD